MTCYERNRACMAGEHHVATPCIYNDKLLSCNCGEYRMPRPVGFIRQADRVVYSVPVDITGRPKNFGVKLHPKAVKAMSAKWRQKWKDRLAAIGVS